MAERRWTEYEDSWLRQTYPKIEVPAEAISRALKRTREAVEIRAHKLKIKRPWGSPEQIEHLKQLHCSWLGSPEQKEHFETLRDLG